MSEIKVPNGYKKTEIGIIPEDWEVFTLEDIANFGGGTTPARDSYDKYYAYGTNPWVKTLDLNNGFLTSTDESVTDTALQEVSLKKHPAGSVLIAMYGGFNQIGRTGLLKMDASINQALVAVIPHKSKLTPEYLLYNLNYNVDYWKNVASSSRKDPNITSNDIKKYALPLPPKPEQIAIAIALTDTDNLIQSLEKLITKKEAIKTGTMQQLLTGKTRLPEFATREDGSAKGFKQTELGKIPEDWDVKTVFDLAERNRLNFNDGDWIESEHIINQGIRLVQTGNIGIGSFEEKDSKKFISESSFNQLNCKQLEVGDLLICRLAEPAGRACIFKGVEETRAITSVDVTIFRPPKNSVSREFYLHVFSSSNWFKSINEQVGGTTHKRISRSALGSICIPYPSFEEQTAIATILSDIDTEIQALQNRLDKTKAIKQGMMQQLLTGKVRLV